MRLLKIGRDASCDIVLHSDRVSSFHAEITLTNSGDILLEDKGSSNGTYIMNQAIAPGKPVTIRRGDPVKLADVDLPWDRVPMPEDNSAYKAVYGIGSHTNNDIKISGGTVSRYHATIKVGKDNKVYIIDHSKNGTTVDGRKIQSNVPVQIKKNNVIVCGGVPLNLANSPVKWPAFEWKKIAIAAACVVLLCGVGSAIYEMTGGSKKEYTDGELYNRYNHSVVMLVGFFHYNVTMGDLNLDVLNNICQDFRERGLLDNSYTFPAKVSLGRDANNNVVAAPNTLSSYTATGFFISNDAKLMTNLHVVKPWLFDDHIKQMEEYKSILTFKLSKVAELIVANQVNLGLTAFISQLKVEGELDYIALIPQGDVFDETNLTKCRVLSAGNDPNVDIALIQTVSKRMPTSDCTYVNVIDSMDIRDEVLKVGEHVYIIGFPAGLGLQELKNEKGIQVIAQGGDIIQMDSEFEFRYNAATTGGASGSPVFNKYGMLIGVHHAGAAATQGYNTGIKTKYVKQLLESPHRTN